MARLVEELCVKYKDMILRKYTVEERDDGQFISTSWDAEDCIEVDRTVVVFETESGALCDMYRNAIAEAPLKKGYEFYA